MYVSQIFLYKNQKVGNNLLLSNVFSFSFFFFFCENIISKQTINYSSIFFVKKKPIRLTNYMVDLYYFQNH